MSGVHQFARIDPRLSGAEFSSTGRMAIVAVAIAWWAAFAALFCITRFVLPHCDGTAFELPSLMATLALGALLDITVGVLLFRFKEDPQGGLIAYAVSHIAAGLWMILSTL